MLDTNAGLPASYPLERCHTKLEIALVFSRLPFPMHKGDQLTVSHLLEFLWARGHQVDLFILDNGDVIQPHQMEWLRTRTRKLNVYRHSIFRRVFGLIYGIAKGWPLQVGYFFNSKQCRDVQKALSKNCYDICYAYYLRSAEACKKSTSHSNQGCVRILAMQLSQVLNTSRMKDNARSVFKRALYSLETFLLQRYEGHIWSSFDKVAIIGKQDLKAIQDCSMNYGPNRFENYFFSPHGTSIPHVQTLKNRTNNDLIIFSGNMNYFPNIQGIQWFVEKVWPSIKRSIKSAQLRIVGKSPAPEVLALAEGEDITVTGEVTDIKEHIMEAAVCVVPIQAAAGMQNKLIEYLSCGRAVVATPLSNEAIQGQHNRDLIEATSAEEFGEAVVSLLNDEDWRKKIGERGKAFVQENWTWEKHFLDLETVFLENKKQ